MKLVLAGLVLVALAAGLFLFVRSKSAAANPTPAGTGQTFEQRYANLPTDALERRRRSNEVMRSEGVPVNEWLPVVESEAEIRLPSTEEVAMRAAANLLVAMKGNGMPQSEVDEIARQYNLARWFSPKEAKFIADPDPPEREQQIQTWRYEAANTLLWSLGFVDRLDSPRKQCDPSEIIPLLRENTRQQFLAKAKLRPASEILDQADLIYRYRWALVDARLHGKPTPAGLSDDVAMERHQAFNWLMEHTETGWDDISLDT